jgi:hypothetical protein
MKYDDASWHIGGDFPFQIDRSQAVVHIGMFLGWAIEMNLAGTYLLNSHADSIERFLARKMTGTEIVIKCCDERLTNEDLNTAGNAFAKDYYETDLYMDEYAAEFGPDVTSLYLVEDSWDNYDRMAKRISVYFEYWKKKQNR